MHCTRKRSYLYHRDTDVLLFDYARVMFKRFQVIPCKEICQYGFCCSVKRNVMCNEKQTSPYLKLIFLIHCRIKEDLFYFTLGKAVQSELDSIFSHVECVLSMHVRNFCANYNIYIQPAIHYMVFLFE